MRDLLVIVSGGHTTSVGMAISEAGAVEACVPGGGLNPHSMPEHVTKRNLRVLLSDLTSALALPMGHLSKHTKKIVLSIPGAARRFDQMLVEAILALLGWPESNQPRVVDDTWSGLLAGTLSYSGICAFAGTGASVWTGGVILEGRRSKVDGWGPFIGDRGSGFQLALDTLRHLARYYDSSREEAQLFESLKLFTKVANGNTHDKVPIYPALENIEEIQVWLDDLVEFNPNDWRIRLAQLAACVTQEADKPGAQGPEVGLVLKAAKEMIESIEISLSHWPSEVPPAVVLQGGMFEHSELYRNSIIGHFQNSSISRIGLALCRPVFGAALMARFPGPMQPPSLDFATTLLNNLNQLPLAQRLLVLRNMESASRPFALTP